MADPFTANELQNPTAVESPGGVQNRKEKRKALKKQKRKQIRREAAIREREEEEARSSDPAEQERMRIREQKEAEIAERERKEFEERERLWLEAAAKRKAEEEERRAKELLAESEKLKVKCGDEPEEDDDWEYVENGPAEIIWQGNEIIVKKKRVKVAKRNVDIKSDDKLQDDDRPTSNPLPPQSAAFASYNSEQRLTAQELLEGVAQQVPNFGTEQDKAHCPFHLKTGACRFGNRCSRVHFHPDKSCTLLIKNMYSGAGLALDQDEELEYPDEEIEHHYEEFYEDVHTEFLKFGELVNFKVCKNASPHLRGNVYVHYKSLESAILAYNTMNGRYFAAKQITCEFVGVTKWKVAICGEYMKSRLRTCSRGTTCNFIHCFRNPGGDYEWADWDNPPPRSWIRKMAVLFGHSEESNYSRQMEQEDFVSPRDSRRKRTPMHGRYHSRRSLDEVEVHDSGSGREDSSYRKRERSCSLSVRSNHSGRRKETSFQDKSEHSNKKHKSKVYNYDSSRERSKKTAGGYLERNLKLIERENSEVDQRYKNNHRKIDESSLHEREETSDKQDKPERKHRSKYDKQDMEEHKLYEQLSNYTVDRRNRSSSHSSEEWHSRHHIDDKEQYDGRHCSNDSDSDRDFSGQRRSKQSNERREHKYASRYHTSLTAHVSSKTRKEENKVERSTSDEYSVRWEITEKSSDREETDGHLYTGSSRSHKKSSKSYEKQSDERRVDKYTSRHHTSLTTHVRSKMRKEETNEDRSTSDDSRGRWEITEKEETDAHLYNGSSHLHRKSSKSYEKLKHRREKRKHHVNTSDSDEDFDQRKHKKYSRHQTPSGPSTILA